MTAFALFSSTFVLVFFLSLQTINVANGRRLAAFATSFGIGLGELILLKLAPDASFLEMLAFLSGGPFGVVVAMELHNRIERARNKVPKDLYPPVAVEGEKA